MSNRKVLFIWTLLTLAAGAGRQWAVGFHEGWEEVLAENKDKYVEVAEAARELKQRRKELAVGDGEDFIQTKLLELAIQANLGVLTIKPARPKVAKNHVDNQFTIGFPHEKGFRRSGISAFLYNAESQLPRIRTIGLEMSPFQSGRAPQTGSERPDEWKMVKVILQRRTPRKDS